MHYEASFQWVFFVVFFKISLGCAALFSCKPCVQLHQGVLAPAGELWHPMPVSKLSSVW